MRINHAVVPAILIVVCSLSYAQTPRMADGGAIPSNPRILPHPDRDLRDKGLKWRVWITHAGLRPLCLPKRDSDAVLLGGAFRFLDKSYGIIAEHPLPEQLGAYLLAAELDNFGRPVRTIGWVHSKCTISRAEAQRDPQTTVLRKAMIVTTDNQIKTHLAANSGFEHVTPIRESPRLDAEPRTKSPWFQYHFIYADIDGWLLLGSADSFTEANASQVIEGWVSADEVCRWDTREAYWWEHRNTLQPDRRPGPRTAPGRLFAKADIAYGSLLNPVDDRFRETLEPRTLGVPPSPGVSRFPRLEFRGAPGAPAQHPETNVQLRKVGWLAAVGKDGRESDISEQEIASLRLKIERIKNKINKIDVLFVIDDTLNMGDWFREVVSIVENIIQAVPQDTGSRIAISYYNDLDNKTKRHQPLRSQLEPINSTAARKMIAELKSHQEQRGVDADPREMVFDGIQGAIQAAKFERDAEGRANVSGRKLVVVIGDTADKTEDLTDTSGEKRIVAMLHPELPSPYEFLAVRVSDVDREKGGKDRDDFRLQMETIVKMLNAAADEAGTAAAATPAEIALRRNLGAVVTSSNAAVVSQKIQQRFDELTDAVRKDQRSLDEALGGNWTTVCSPSLLKELDNEGIDVEKLRRARGLLVFREGFVWQDSPADKPAGERHSQLRLWALLDRNDLGHLKTLMDNLLRDRKQSVRSVVEQEILRLSGEKQGSNITDLSLATELKKKGLDVRSKFLRTPLRKLSESLTREQLEELAEKRDKITDILALTQSKWERTYITLPDGREAIQSAQIGKPIKFDRRYPIPGSNADWFWVDVAEELP